MNIRYFAFGMIGSMMMKKLLLLNESQALIMASLWKGFGLPDLEEIAWGTPVIASERGALPEALAEHGYFVNPLIIESIASAMKSFIIDRNYFQQALLEGLRRVRPLIGLILQEQ